MSTSALGHHAVPDSRRMMLLAMLRPAMLVTQAACLRTAVLGHA